jgi:hypothetical protein
VRHELRRVYPKTVFQEFLTLQTHIHRATPIRIDEGGGDTLSEQGN